MAQNFYAAFGLGESERYISTVDADGVALAAIQGLFEIVQEQNSLIRMQDDRITEIESRLIELDQLIGEQEKKQPSLIQWLGWLLFGGIAGKLGWMKIYNSGLSRRSP